MQTPIQKYNLENVNLYIKREDYNLNGSFKDRSIAPWMDYYISNSEEKAKLHFVVSSSGNAAISATYFAALYNVCLDIFIGENIPEYKLQRILAMIKANEINGNKSNLRLHISSKAKSDAMKFVYANPGSIYLRGSIDDNAVSGYREVGQEIAKFEMDQNIRFGEIYMPISSGTGFIGISDELLDHKFVLYQIPECKPIYDAINSDENKPYDSEVKSKVNCIVDRVCHRKEQVVSRINETNSEVQIITNQDLDIAENYAKLLDIPDMGVNQLGTLAGFIKKYESNKQYYQNTTNNICLIFTGI